MLQSERELLSLLHVWACVLQEPAFSACSSVRSFLSMCMHVKVRQLPACAALLIGQRGFQGQGPGRLSKMFDILIHCKLNVPVPEHRS